MILSQAIYRHWQNLISPRATNKVVTMTSHPSYNLLTTIGTIMVNCKFVSWALDRGIVFFQIADCFCVLKQVYFQNGRQNNILTAFENKNLK